MQLHTLEIYIILQMYWRILNAIVIDDELFENLSKRQILKIERTAFAKQCHPTEIE